MLLIEILDMLLNFFRVGLIMFPNMSRYNLFERFISFLSSRKLLQHNVI